MAAEEINGAVSDGQPENARHATQAAKRVADLNNVVLIPVSSYPDHWPARTNFSYVTFSLGEAGSQSQKKRTKFSGNWALLA